MKIALLEDELMLADSIMEYLKSLNHKVYMFNDGMEAYNDIVNNSYDLLIFDINVPSLNGFNLLKKLRDSNIHVPVIYISALSNIDDIEYGFELGCSDYLKKPFHLKELALRINRLVETSRFREKHHVLLSQNYTYDLDNKILYFQGIIQDLTKRQLDIIDLLVSHKGMVVTYEAFREYVYVFDYIDNPTIRAEVKRLRDVLKEDLIINTRGLGYKISKFFPNP
ncbi:MAG: response regulator transcription factor [Campylobacteraceae bacterium]|jgi:DNA-binding response OmpR family regulator|nr:response regulator transcription factor [Campylobacteraceae bacterium]MBT3882148.1 response regulator transcription factor [Campylobacteraceae bacterium]MBT4572830.1 response regulator transcription factor [Campylobacteraceae bacterium]MBT6108307.1 response regulator transcription factor [Campylobacteraceae bacterium]MBT7117074.1 response regulator transcription factor [Campylobacteraceae bacterium]